jgi:hypothetical protein
MNKFLKILLGTGIYLLEQSDEATKEARARASEHIDDLRDAAQQKYRVAANRVAKASRAIRGEDISTAGNILRFAAGMGVGIGVGLLLAPASGDETRDAINHRVREFGGKVRQQFSAEDSLRTGAQG